MRKAYRFFLRATDHGGVDKAWAGHVHLDIFIDELHGELSRMSTG